MIIFEKEYDAEGLYDVARDVCEAFYSEFNPVVKQIPTDEYGLQEGKFKVSIVWED